MVDSQAILVLVLIFKSSRSDCLIPCFLAGTYKEYLYHFSTHILNRKAPQLEPQTCCT